MKAIENKYNYFSFFKLPQSITIFNLSLFLLGLITGLSYHLSIYPLIATFLYLLGHSLFFYILTRAHKNKSLGVFIFYLGYFFSALYWIGYSFSINEKSIPSLLGLKWLILKLSFLLVPLLFSINMLIAHFFIKKKIMPNAQKFIYGMIFIFVEYLRGEFYLGGFPWALPYEFLPFELLQFVAYIGIYGLSAYMTTGVVIISICLFNDDNKIKIWPVLFFICSFLILYFLGNQRLKSNQPSYTDTYIRLVQPCIDQYKKRSSYYFKENIKNLFDLSNLTSDRSLDFIIWPETAFGDFFHQNNIKFSEFLEPLDSLHVNLIFGSVRYQFNQESNKKEKLNSMFVLNKEAEDPLIAVYDKKKLVPGPEYLPLNIKFIQKLTKGSVFFTPGLSKSYLEIPNQPIALPLICYEVIFPNNEVSDQDWIINITNDAWFKRSQGPKQHLRIAKIRAIETGLPLVRAANNGVSAIIDPMGRVIQSLNTNEKGVVDGYVPEKILIEDWAKNVKKYFFPAYMALNLLLGSYLFFSRRNGLKR